ncbi:MAG: hypothetical protein JSW65_00550 [Candidatus Bipolaricaulota bacterium]|nr:MAG: hypothetical protein JSW65_00550 [Candidatus Bipolaricaulota bacterium]
MKATVVLSEGAGKRIIAKGVTAEPAVRRALESGTVVVTLGTTNAFVAEELLGEPIDRGAFAAGFIDRVLNVNARLGERGELILRNGAPWEGAAEELLEGLAAGDVVIKGGNALDPWGTVGVLMAARTGGTVARYHALALARGVAIVIPISVRKAIHGSVSDLAMHLGADRIEHSMGLPCGMYPLTGRVITELDALELLFDVRATQIAGGGVGLGAGSVSLLLEGEDEAVTGAFELVRSVADEPDVELRGRV